MATKFFIFVAFLTIAIWTTCDAFGQGTAGAGAPTGAGTATEASTAPSSGSTQPATSSPTMQGPRNDSLFNQPSGTNSSTGATSTNPSLPSAGCAASPPTAQQNPNGINSNLSPNGPLNAGGKGAGRIDTDRRDMRQDRQDLRQDRNDLRTDRAQERIDTRNDPDRWRFARYNNEWWYWMPGNYWMFYRDNNWNRYDADSFQPYFPNSRYTTAYRGIPDENSGVYIDEYGRQYRRDYSPLRRALRGAEEALGAGRVEVNAAPAPPAYKLTPHLARPGTLGTRIRIQTRIVDRTIPEEPPVELDLMLAPRLAAPQVAIGNCC